MTPELIALAIAHLPAPALSRGPDGFVQPFEVPAQARDAAQ